MKKREFLKTGGAVAAAMSFPLTVQAQGATYNWKMATGWGGGPLTDLGTKAFADKLEQFSGGRFKIQIFPGGALGNACLLYTSPSPRDRQKSRMPSSA